MKIAVGLSGGIDSTASVLKLLHEGHDVVAVFLNMLPEGVYQEKTCCSLDSKLLARRVAKQIGVPFEEWNLQEDFSSNVISIFKAMMKRGLTPNPCVFCNRSVKLGTFVRMALERGFDAVATGHYARQCEGQLYKGKDLWKDQSYMLSLVSPDILKHVIFPLGNLTREDVIDFAQSNGITYIPRSSQDICFMPQGGFDAFVQQSFPELSKEGNVIYHGKTIGQHRGYAYYTIGQRKGIGIGFKEPLYVKAVEPKTNTVFVGTSEELFSGAMDVAVINNFMPVSEMSQIKIRYHAPSVNAHVERIKGTILHVVFEKPVRAITPGQVAVAYEDDAVQWAGIILR
ncbi:tRNA 2-thiouridine(34) synthase MnmA [Coprothermobacter platensis]|uniref:tRNA 2-thiouridine(34) synthase MnmA n=1 Tax=Coprothermobacter platensis TaxID=108819 RepID=UPI000361E4F0|nr:tRNA 2-thiouridine(34) synthase MnmA [Coprothermobacter platensis]